MFEKYEFTKNWTNPTDFPTIETDETKVRSDMQILHDETKQALHKLIDDLAAETAGENIGVVGEGGASTLQAVLGALLLVKHSHGNLEELERLVTEFNGMGVTQSLVADASKIPTSQAIIDQLDALGAGDMTARVYDPQGKKEDIFAYADAAANAITAGTLGLGNVDDTSDMDKPVSTAQAAAIAEAKQIVESAATAAIAEAKQIAESAATAAQSAGAKADAITVESIGAAASSHNHSTSNITSGTLGVARGGTGKATHTSNAVLTGNGTSAVNNVATASGALYATSANGAAKFGTLPIAQGGTGATTGAAALKALFAAGNAVMSSYQYGTALPTSGFTAGRIFFKKVEE